MEPIGTIHQRDRTIILYLDKDREGYRLNFADFQQFLTQKAQRGCRAASLEEAMGKLRG
jgi:hypothetical protein